MNIKIIKKTYSKWERWFAWYPVIWRNRFIWFSFVWRECYWNKEGLPIFNYSVEIPDVWYTEHLKEKSDART